MYSKTGIEMWKEAKKLIPGGTMLLSKRSETFLPGLWPAYYKRAKGVDIWDMDDNKLLDMGIMGVGSCVLGYSDDDVNAAVKKVVDAGSMCTLNSPEDLDLAHLLLEMHPWAGMVRWARCGGEAMAVAVRIGRAHTKKDKVAFCGYHGWHDWYIAANLAGDGVLDGHLLPGLQPTGVPRGLQGTALPFNYNHIEELEEIVRNNNDIGVIVLEPIRYKAPDPGFLEKVREIADRIGAVLVYDEVTSGWRICPGGYFNLTGVNPDIVVYAKAIGNGYPMATIIGKGNIMEAACESFISSTYWTERIGPAAALATINKYVGNQAHKHIQRIGDSVVKVWNEMIDKHSLDIEVKGRAMSPLAALAFNQPDGQMLKTLFSQEMLKQGILCGGSVYVSFSHQDEHVERFAKAVDKAFGVLAEAADKGDVASRLEGEVAPAGFKRLT
jgi:glutamate-1-semialdehyde 2,1-aminomutase